MKTEIILTWDTSTGTSWLKRIVEVEDNDDDNQTTLSRAIHNYFFETKKLAKALQDSWNINDEDVFLYPVCESSNKKLESKCNLIIDSFFI